MTTPNQPAPEYYEKPNDKLLAMTEKQRKASREHEITIYRWIDGKETEIECVVDAEFQPKEPDVGIMTAGFYADEYAVEIATGREIKLTVAERASVEETLGSREDEAYPDDNERDYDRFDRDDYSDEF